MKLLVTQFSQPYKTRGKIIILCIVILTPLDSKREDVRVWIQASVTRIQSPHQILLVY
jgi:hypothetical protein